MIRHAIVLAGLLSACIAPAASPTPTPIPIESVVVATFSPVASPSPSLPVYASAALGYRVELPRPWRLACGSNGERPLGEAAVADFFAGAPETSERWGDTGYPFDLVYVSVRPNPDRFTAERWVANGRLGGCCGTSVR